MLARWAQPERPPMGTTCAHHGYSHLYLCLSAALASLVQRSSACARVGGAPPRAPAQLLGLTWRAYLPLAPRMSPRMWLAAAPLRARTPRHRCRGAVQSGRRTARRRRAALARQRRVVAASGGSQLPGCHTGKPACETRGGSCVPDLASPDCPQEGSMAAAPRPPRLALALLAAALLGAAADPPPATTTSGCTCNDGLRACGFLQENEPFPGSDFIGACAAVAAQPACLPHCLLRLTAELEDCALTSQSWHRNLPQATRVTAPSA